MVCKVDAKSGMAADIDRLLKLLPGPSEGCQCVFFGTGTDKPNGLLATLGRSPCPECGGHGILDGDKVVCEQCGYSARG